jgi:glycosyltransferase involved in cell wall biosynthesis
MIAATTKMSDAPTKRGAVCSRQGPGGAASTAVHEISVAVLTGGSDKPYVFGLTNALLSQGAVLDLIGSDELDVPELRGRPCMNFMNLRGNQSPNAGFSRKALRVLRYYARLLRYAATARPEIFHVLWNNKFEAFDRTLLMLFYKWTGKKIVLTVHNVNAGKRDGRDTRLNRLTLRIQYRLADHLFVHTEKMKSELTQEFSVPGRRITVVPFGINNAVPNTRLTSAEAKRRLGLTADHKTLLFFGRITPYKGLEYLITAFRSLARKHGEYRLVIAGRPDQCESYWQPIRADLRRDTESGAVLLRPDFIPDDEVEVYFKGADALVLPYRDIYQSGVLFLAHSFGLPVLAADVGSLRDDIVEGETGFVFAPEDAEGLVESIERYFLSELYANLNSCRQVIREMATQRHSWDIVGEKTMSIYGGLLRIASREESLAAMEGAPSVEGTLMKKDDGTGNVCSHG